MGWRCGGREIFLISVSCKYGSLSVSESTLAGMQSLELASREAGAGSVEGRGDLTAINTLLMDMTYQSSSFLNGRGRDSIRIRVTDGNGGTGTALLYVVVTTSNMPSTVSLTDTSLTSGDTSASVSVSVFSMYEDTVFDFPLLSVSNPNEVDSSDESTQQLEAVVTAVHGGGLEIQEITTAAPHIDGIHEVSIRMRDATDPDSEAAIIKGTVRLSLDVAYGALCGAPLAESATGDSPIMTRLYSEKIYADAVAMREQEKAGYGMGRDVHESMQAKVEGMLEGCGGGTVSVEREAAHGGGMGYLWRVTFHDVSFDFSVMQVEEYSFTLSESNSTNAIDADVSVNVIMSRPGNEVGGYFSVTFGADQSALIPHNASSESLSRILLAMESVDAVSVTRSDVTKEGGYTWSVTFFGVTIPTWEAGSPVPLLQADTSPLTGDWDYAGADVGSTVTVIPADVLIARTSMASGSPRVFSVAYTTLA